MPLDTLKEKKNCSLNKSELENVNGGMESTLPNNQLEDSVEADAIDFSKVLVSKHTISG